jgi:ubiquitin-like protein Pup
MAAKGTSGRPQAAKDTEEAAVRPAELPDDVGAILDDMDEALEENAEEIVRSYVQEGGQ